MYEIVDKLVLFLCCTTLYLFHSNTSFVIVPIIISISLSSLFLYFEDIRIRLGGIVFFAVLCIFSPIYIIFMPLLLYDILHTRYQYSVLLIPFIMVYHDFRYTSLTVSFIMIYLVIAFHLKYKTDRLNKLNSEYNNLRDSSAHMSILLEEKNQDLLKNQDYEINLATLNERNRISKELHDNIGHLLSRSLLQIGALLTVAKDELTREALTDLKESISNGMDQIRSTIHNMYDESIDLYMQIENIVKNFTFCPINYDYDITNPPSLQLKYSLLAITKEALANIIRHSDATNVSLQLREHPAMYQLIIKDNGTIDETHKKILSRAFEKEQYGEGMGLRNIYDRVKSYNGNINISVDKGFQLFITIPKNSKH